MSGRHNYIEPSSVIATSGDIVLNFAYVSLIGLIIVNYLIVNKIWSRKHEIKVADSISVVAILFEIFLLLPFYIMNFLSMSYLGIIKDTMGFIIIYIYFLIGIGYWVNNGFTFWHKVKRSIIIERSEVTRLLKDVLGFRNIKKVFIVLCEFALVDKNLHEKEEKLLRDFAQEHKLNYDVIIKQAREKIEKKTDSFSISELNAEVDDYIKTAPPKRVIEWLRDMIVKIIEIDSDISSNEKIASDEITAKLNSYLLVDKKDQKMFNLVLIPQSKEIEESIILINKDLKKINRPGSENTYLVASFYSLHFAEIVRLQYVELFKCFVAIERF